MEFKKLHLGCGQRYLDGYVNIDFPLSEHSTQEKSIADELADVLALRYPANSIAEVRLHHVYEHFPRPVASTLVACWNSWLMPGGILHIEVPDLERTSKAVISPFRSLKKKAVAERHLFGSHEAHWADHYEGYTPELLKLVVESFGFKKKKIKRNSWMGTYNIEIIAKKVHSIESAEQAEERLKKYLSMFLLNENPDELKLLSIWLKDAKTQWEKCKAL